MNTTQTIDQTESITQRLMAMNATVETRARALQAAYIAEIFSTAIGHVGTALRRLVHGWREWSERQRALANLERMDDRLLADMGLSHDTLREALSRADRTATAVPPVEAVITDAAPTNHAANQDTGQDRSVRRHAA